MDTDVIEGEVATENKIAKVEPNVAALATMVDSKDLKKAVAQLTKQRQIIAEFIKDQLKEGVDFGKIEGETKSGATFLSKPVLFKPGQEKIFSLFNLTSELTKDTETVEMLNKTEGLVAYKCNVYRNGQKIAEGRGAAVIGDKSRDANATIKIAEKRARMDACLSLGFSEYFTQDLEDPEYRNKKPQDSRPMSNAQRKMIYKLLTDRGIHDHELQKQALKLNGIKDTSDISLSDASKLIDKLVKGQFADPAEPENIEDQPDEQDENIVITPDLKDELLEKIESFGLSANAKLRFIKETTGQISTAHLTDQQWMELSQKVESVLDSEIELNDDGTIKSKTSKTKQLSEVDDGTGDTEN